jgi:predicted pyridoxine 5'-phosphate oxidase superfamily flavin-nucleotide-binding protein
VATLPQSARELIESGALAHLVTIGRDGAPQVTCIWVGLDGEEIVSGHLREQQKLRNVRRDPRVTLSLELLQRLARVYLGPDVKFPPMENPPPGYTMRVSVERIGGVGPWRT